MENDNNGKNEPTVKIGRLKDVVFPWVDPDTHLRTSWDEQGNMRHYIFNRTLGKEIIVIEPADDKKPLEPKKVDGAQQLPKEKNPKTNG